MQEHETCQACDNGDCECEGGRDEDGHCQDHECKCELPVYGETFSYDRCEECDKFLRAVAKAEQEAGCDWSESQPALCQMIEDIQNGGMDEAKKYFVTALREFPELVKSGYLGKLWRRLFG